MAERERRMTRPYGGVFVARAEVMNAEEVGRALRRMAHEILEHNGGIHNRVLIGLQTGGVTVAGALAGVLAEIEGLEDHAGEAPDEAGSGEEQHDDADDGAPGHVIPVGTLDVALYRDDIGIRPVLPEEVTDIPVDLDGADVVLLVEGEFDAMAPENVSPLVVWLGSLDSAFVTGRVFEVEAGKVSLADGWQHGPKRDKGARWAPRELTDVVRDLIAEAPEPAPVYGAG